MINAVVERNMWYYSQGNYITVKVRIADVSKNGINRIMVEPMDWMKPNGNLMYLSYGGKKYKIITLTGCHLSPELALELVHVPGTEYYRLSDAYFFNLSNYEDV